MRTDIRVVLGLVIVAALLTACGSKSGTGGEEPAQEESKPRPPQEEINDDDRQPILDAIIFKGNTALTSKALTSLMKSKGAPIDGQVLEEDFMVIEGHYRNFGYINARVTALERRPSDKQGHVDLILTIDEGAKHTVSKVTISGLSEDTSLRWYPRVPNHGIHETLDLTSVLACLQMQPDVTYSSKMVREDTRFLRTYFQATHYLNVRVLPKLSEAGENALNIDFSISKGAPWFGEIRR